MSERRCFGCMRVTSRPVCEHCGWPADQQNEPHQLPAGTVLQGKYLIGRVLGQGGFGITYLGWDLNLDIQICIKEFYPSANVNRDTSRSMTVNCNTTSMERHYTACLERFLREGKALAKFRNVPQIVGIHDFFQLNNTAYMVMEFVNGIDLDKYVQKRGGRLHMDEVLKILLPIMKALQLVHDAGIIHRDISPDNIMLDPREGAKLLDFGAVRNVEHPDAEKELTQATEAILKHGFAPMEQFVAKGPLGPWTDVYAMSATIYYCLTGRIPEDAPVRLMEGAKLDWSGAQGLTERQKAVLEHGMAPRAKDRILSIRELAEQLYAPKMADGPGERGDAGKPEPPRTGKKRWPLIAAMAAVLAALVITPLLLPKGIRETDGGLVYYSFGAKQTGQWYEKDGARYYFGEDGFAVSGFCVVDGVKYCFSDDHTMVTGWYTVSGEKYYMDPDGVVSTGSQTIGGKQYYFDAQGRMVTGEQIIDGETYIFGPDGAFIGKADGSEAEGQEEEPAPEEGTVRQEEEPAPEEETTQPEEDYPFSTEGLTRLDLSDVTWVNYGIQPYGSAPNYFAGYRLSSYAAMEVPFDGVTMYIKINAPYELGIRSGYESGDLYANHYWLNDLFLTAGNKDQGYFYTLPAGHKYFILSIARVTRDDVGNVISSTNAITLEELDAIGLEIWYG